ncbi:MAG TPA: lipoprotein [Sphingomicrobium sp.]|nr:lipoprotein [Sphingomicrobium sp.]
MKRMLAAATLVLALAACQQNDPNNIAIDEGNSLNADIETLPPDEGNEETAAANSGGLNEADDAGSEQPSPPNTSEASMIPGQYRGRWGMVVADCDRNRSDAKGAMTIGERNIVFYESKATLKEQRPAIATSFAGLFAFTGEGQSWEKVMTFTRTGNTLKRAEETGTFTYTRCA